MRRLSRIVLGLALFIGAAAALLALRVSLAASTDMLSIAVSILPEKYLVERIGGSRVDVTVLVGPGQSPATYEPTPQQMTALDAARLYFRIGVPFEAAWMNQIEAANPTMSIVDIAEGIVRRRIERIDNGRKGDEQRLLDPHVWTDPSLARQMSTRIRDALINADPEHGDEYRKNCVSLAGDLAALDAEIRKLLSPLQQRAFLTFHPSWGYFADAYGLRQIPIESEGKEPGPRTLIDVITEARRVGINVVFVQPQFSRSSAEMVAREIGGRVVAIDPLAEDYISNLRKVATAFAGAARAR